MQVKCFAQEHNTMTEPGLEPRPSSLESSLLTIRLLQENYEFIFSPNSLNPLHPEISMHILLTVLYTFPKNADKDILLNNQELLFLLIISIILITLMFVSWVIL